MKALKSYMLKMDMLGKEHGVIFKGESRIKSLVGSCLTVLLVGLVIVAAVLLGQDIIFKAKPTITRTQRFSRGTEIPFEDMKPIIGFGTANGQPITKDSDIRKSLEIFLEVYEIRFQEPSRVILYQFQPCTREMFTDFELSKFNADLLKLEDFLCLNSKSAFNPETREPVPDHSLTFMNEYGYAISNTIQIKIRACNEKLFPGCRKGLDEISSFFVTVQNKLSYLSLTDYDNPSTVYYRSESSQVSKNIFQREFLKFKQNIVFTDEGFIFEDLREESFVTFDSKSKQTLFYDETTRNLYGMNYEVSFLVDEYSRDYLKIQQLAAELGGFMKACWSIAALFMKYYSRYVFYVATDNGSPEQISRFTVNERQNSSATKINIKKEDSKVKINFFNFFIALISKKTRIRYNFDEKKRLKIFDANEIENRLRNLEFVREEEIRNDD